MEKPKELSSIDRKVYKKWLSNGDFSSIHTTLGEKQYKKALVYIAKKSSEWMHLLEVGFPIPSKETTPDPQLTPVVIQTPGKRRATAPLQHHPEGKKAKKKHNERKCKKVKTLFPISIEPTFDNPIPLYPRRRVPYKTDYAQFKLGDHVTFILPAYHDFLIAHSSLLPPSTVTDGDTLIQQYQAISLSTLTCQIIAIELLPEIADDTFSLSLRSQENKTLSVIVIDPRSKILLTAPHIIQQQAFQKSMEQLQRLHSKFNGILTTDPQEYSSKDTKITQTFAIPKRDHPDEIEGELYEGMIYDVNEDALENPYHSIHVVWYGKSIITGKWVMDFYQLDNDTSPWDLQISSIAQETTEQEQILRSPFIPDPQSILNALLTEEGMSIFENSADLVELDDYSKIISRPMDFTIIQQKIDNREYEREKESIFWADLESIVSNAKAFNQPERVEWRIADILEKGIKRIQQDIRHSRIRYSPAITATPLKVPEDNVIEGGISNNEE